MDTSTSSPKSPVSTIGVLLVNLGTPASPAVKAVRTYLAEFLSDPRVIDYPRWLWLPLLYCVILALRPSQSAKAYASIWTAQGSPLMVNSRALTDAVAQGCESANIRVELAMRYGQPSVASALQRLLSAGARRVLVLPLYPQYSATSTASVFDAVNSALSAVRHVPEFRTIADYHAEPDYIDALAASVQEYWRTHGRAERLLLSFHGIPQRYVRAGDPYATQCLETAALLRDRLGLDESSFVVSFQSRVGREKWLEPYTDETFATLARQGVRRIQVLCPGFAVDCLETLEEIAIRGEEQFIAAGGEKVDYIPALNAGADHVKLMRALIDRHIRGWVE
ncbi:MAG: ferrochelatase [Rudaea sp.]